MRKIFHTIHFDSEEVSSCFNRTFVFFYITFTSLFLRSAELSLESFLQRLGGMGTVLKHLSLLLTLYIVIYELNFT